MLYSIYHIVYLIYYILHILHIVCIVYHTLYIMYDACCMDPLCRSAAWTCFVDALHGPAL